LRSRPEGTAAFRAPWGWVLLNWGGRGLRELRIRARKPRGGVRDPLPASIARAVRRALRGLPFRPPRYDLDGMTPFQRKVLLELSRLPSGRLITYGGLAKRIGRPRASRAVGQAVGRNPIPLLIPCHRVVAARNGIGGFSSGLSLKQKMLKNEGFTVNYGRKVL